MIEENQLLFKPNDKVKNIFNPQTKKSYPINNKLLKIYNLSKGNKDYYHLIKECKTDYLKVETEIVKESLSMNLINDLLPADLKDNELLTGSTGYGEFYVIVQLNSLDSIALKDQSEYKFNTYLENIIYNGQGEIGRNHTSKNSSNIGSGNQGDLTRFMQENSLNNFKTISSVPSKYKSVMQMKEFSTFLVYNRSNSFNSSLTTFEIPINLVNDYEVKGLYDLFVNCGIFTLFENYQIMKSKLEEFKYKDKLILDANKITINEEEVKKILRRKIKRLNQQELGDELSLREVTINYAKAVGEYFRPVMASIQETSKKKLNKKNSKKETEEDNELVQDDMEEEKKSRPLRPTKKVNYVFDTEEISD